MMRVQQAGGLAGTLGDHRDDPLREVGVARAQVAEADVEQRLVAVGREGRYLVGRFLAHAALQILEVLGIEREAPLELDRLGIEQQVQMG